jgi:putative transcriptional regulator
VTLGEMIEELGDSEELPERVWIGGPVASWQLFLLFRTEDGPQDAESVLDGIYFSISREVLESLLESDVEFRIYAGYAGWAPGQLQAEIEREGWHVLPGDPEMVFARDPSTLWQELIVRGEARWTSHPATAPGYQRAMDQAPGRGRVTFAGHVGQ